MSVGSSVPNPNTNILGEDNSWDTTILCLNRQCTGTIQCWVSGTKNTKPVHYYFCNACNMEGSWYEFARKVTR